MRTLALSFICAALTAAGEAGAEDGSHPTATSTLSSVRATQQGIAFTQLAFISRLDIPIAGTGESGSALVTVSPLVGVRSTSITLRSPQGLPFSADLRIPWQPSYGLRLDTRLWAGRATGLHLTLRAELPFSPTTSRIDAISIEGDRSPTGLDAAALASDIRIEHRWEAYDAGLRATVHAAGMAWLRFHADLGVMATTGSVDIRLDETSAGILDWLDARPKASYATDTVVPYLFPGISANALGGTIGLRATVLRTARGSFRQVDLSVSLPLL